MKFSFSFEREKPLSLGLDLPSMSEVVNERRKAEKQVSRTYKAAKVNRLTNDWSTVSTSANYEMRYQLRILRARSRSLARNNDYMKKFLGLVRSNVVGPTGIKLQCQAADSNGELTRPLNKKIEDSWKEWCKPGNASVSGKLSFRDQLALFIGTVARDGEVLIREIAADNEFGYALQFFDVNWLDENFNEQASNGNRIIMSVEVDGYGKPVAYWFTPPRYAHLFPENNFSVKERTRVPAEEVIHKFLIFDDEQQTRGVPWAHTAMLRLNMHGGYEESEVIAARIGASKMDYLVPPTGDEHEDSDDDGPTGEIPLKMEPGMLPILPAGWDVKSGNNDHPNAQYAAFNKAVLRGVASGLDVSYFSLANDLEAVNFSSARIGLLEERDGWRAMQQWTIEHLCERVFKNWLKSAILYGKVQLRPHEYVRVANPAWRPRGWMWVDPVKDVQATTMAVDNGLGTRTDAIAMQGLDFDELTTTLQHEQKMLEEKGIRLVSASTAPAMKNEEDPDSGPGKDSSQE